MRASIFGDKPTRDDQIADVIGLCDRALPWHTLRKQYGVRIEPQISTLMPPPLRLASHDAGDPAVRSSLSVREQRISDSARCDRYAPCADAPGALLYADYLEKQNRRKPVSAELAPAYQAPSPLRQEPIEPLNTGLAHKIGDIPNPEPEVTKAHTRIIRAYQFQRYSPVGSLVDVII